MSKPLERRLARLEAAPGVVAEMPMIFVSFLSPCGTETPVATATVDGRVWHREPGEAEQAFCDRVGAEVRGARPGCLTLAFLG